MWHDMNASTYNWTVGLLREEMNIQGLVCFVNKHVFSSQRLFMVFGDHLSYYNDSDNDNDTRRSVSACYQLT